MNMMKGYREEGERARQKMRNSEFEMEITIISSQELISIMEMDPESVLVIDCRPFTSFNTDHISTSSNIYCPPIIKRRLAKRTEAKIENMLNCETKKKLRNGVYRSLVVYDEDTQSVSEDTDLHFICRNLYKFVCSKNCFCLQGKM